VVVEIFKPDCVQVEVSSVKVLLHKGTMLR
jgi:hypothetical protein